MVWLSTNQVQSFGLADYSLGEHATDRWLVRIDTYFCLHVADIVK